MRKKEQDNGHLSPKTGKKKWIIAGAVVLVLAAAAAGNNGDNKPDNAGSPETSLQSSVADVETETPEVSTEAEENEAEPNTTEKVDSLAREAKAAVAEGVTDEQRDEAVNFIVEHYPQFYTDNETMESAMYYGYWLEYAYSSDEAARDYAELGMDTYQAVKYVYRNVEGVEDEATQENLRQIKETLETLGYKVD